jgi:predicted RNase H-like HicB family nuclease
MYEDLEVATPVVLEPDEDDGGFVSSIVDLPGVRSQGETEHQAIENVLDALRCALDMTTPEPETPR